MIIGLLFQLVQLSILCVYYASVFQLLKNIIAKLVPNKMQDPISARKFAFS